MRISHKYKFVFISKPRCGSTTVRQMLDSYSDIFGTANDRFHYHATAMEIKLEFEKHKWPWEKYFIFTTVRNPWEMMVSYYTFFKPDINGLYNYETERNGIIYQPNNLSSFENWIINGEIRHILYYDNGTWFKDIWVKGFSRLALSTVINNVDGQSLVNKVLKVEDFETTLPAVFRNLGLEGVSEIKRTNRSSHSHYRDYYNLQTRKIIETEFASDIEFGKYTF